MLSDNKYITQAEAARLRNVSRSRISMLVKKGRLTVYNDKYLDKTEVLNLQPKQSGAPKKIRKYDGSN